MSVWDSRLEVLATARVPLHGNRPQLDKMKATTVAFPGTATGTVFNTVTVTAALTVALIGCSLESRSSSQPGLTWATSQA